MRGNLWKLVSSLCSTFQYVLRIKLRSPALQDKLSHCYVSLLWEEPCLLTSDKEGNRPKHRLTGSNCKSLPFTGATQRNVGEGLLTGVEMTQRQLNHQSPPQHRAHQGWSPGGPDRDCRQFNRLESVLPRQYSWTERVSSRLLSSSLLLSRSLSCLLLCLSSPYG